MKGKLLAIMIMLLCLAALFAATQAEDGVLVIPAGTTRIGEQAFMNDTDIRKVVLPEGIREIGESAFEGCANLEEINLPDGLEAIGSCAFLECSSLKAITIPGSVDTIPSGAFVFCSSLKDVTIMEGVSSIEPEAFYECSSFKELVVPGTVRQLPYGCFAGCSFTRVTICEGVREFQDEVFGGDLEYLSLPASLSSMYPEAMENVEVVGEFHAPERSLAYAWGVKRGYITLTGSLKVVPYNDCGDGEITYDGDDITWRGKAYPDESNTLFVHASGSWQATSDSGWLELYVDREDGRVEFHMDDLGSGTRTGHIIITGGGKRVRVTVIQCPGLFLELTGWAAGGESHEANEDIHVPTGTDLALTWRFNYPIMGTYMVFDWDDVDFPCAIDGSAVTVTLPGSALTELGTMEFELRVRDEYGRECGETCEVTVTEAGPARVGESQVGTGIVG